MAGSTVASPQAGPLLHVAPARNTAGAAPDATRYIFVSFEGPGDSGLAPERGAGAGATRSRGPTRGDATVEPAKARRPPALARLRGHIPEGTLFRPPTRPLGMRPCRREPERVCPGAASRSGVASIGQARWNLLRPARARKTVTTPCSRPTQGGADAVIGANLPVPSRRRRFIGLRQVQRLRCCAPCKGDLP